MPSTSTYRRIAPHVAWLLVCAIAAAPIWLGPGIIHTRAGGDSPFLLQRTFELAENIRAGIVPARWMPNANFGLGYPFFNFYASLPYYFAALLHVLGLDLIFSIQFIQALGMVAGGATMYLLARQFLSPHGAALAAIAYTLAPFHLANLYVRGDSLSEFWAFACFPLILWGVLRGSKRGWGAMTLGLAALACTHNVSTLLFAPFFSIVGVFKSQAPRARSQESRAKSQEPRVKIQEPRAKNQD
ncbi:MAG: 6-pyruvoyl-tetrahydropterin synthase-related protein [Anaerolineae bacterium]|nr:6-pyruvoyl-tetrahydropterin synthase-related protein [Anaerolineae bacterium]